MKVEKVYRGIVDEVGIFIHAGVGSAAGIDRGVNDGSGSGDYKEIEFEVGDEVDLMSVCVKNLEISVGAGFNR